MCMRILHDPQSRSRAHAVQAVVFSSSPAVIVNLEDLEEDDSNAVSNTRARRRSVTQRKFITDRGVCESSVKQNHNSFSCDIKIGIDWQHDRRDNTVPTYFVTNDIRKYHQYKLKIQDLRTVLYCILHSSSLIIHLSEIHLRLACMIQSPLQLRLSGLPSAHTAQCPQPREAHPSPSQPVPVPLPRFTSTSNSTPCYCYALKVVCPPLISSPPIVPHTNTSAESGHPPPVPFSLSQSIAASRRHRTLH